MVGHAAAPPLFSRKHLHILDRFQSKSSWKEMGATLYHVVGTWTAARSSSSLELFSTLVYRADIFIYAKPRCSYSTILDVTVHVPCDVGHVEVIPQMLRCGLVDIHECQPEHQPKPDLS